MPTVPDGLREIKRTYHPDGTLDKVFYEDGSVEVREYFEDFVDDGYYATGDPAGHYEKGYNTVYYTKEEYNNATASADIDPTSSKMLAKTDKTLWILSFVWAAAAMYILKFLFHAIFVFPVPGMPTPIVVLAVIALFGLPQYMYKIRYDIRRGHMDDLHCEVLSELDVKKHLLPATIIYFVLIIGLNVLL